MLPSLLGIPRRECLMVLSEFFLFFRRQGFRMITFDRQARPLHNLNRSWEEVYRFLTPGRPQEDVFANKISVSKNLHPHAPAQPSEHSPQSWCNNKYSQQLLCEIWTTTTNTSNKYTMSEMSLYTSSSLSINDHLECSRTIGYDMI